MYSILELVDSSSKISVFDQLRFATNDYSLSKILSVIYGRIETAKAVENSKSHECSDMFDRKIAMFQAALEASLFNRLIKNNANAKLPNEGKKLEVPGKFINKFNSPTDVFVRFYYLF